MPENECLIMSMKKESKKRKRKAEKGPILTMMRSSDEEGNIGEAPVKKAKKKKSKKAKAVVAAPAPAVDAEGKKKKKKKKRSKVIEPVVPVAEPVKKKKKKKSKKVAVAAAAAPVEEKEEAPKKKKKKSKKNKKGPAGEVIVKEKKARTEGVGGFTYQEHADITAMTAEAVQAYRKESLITLCDPTREIVGKGDDAEMRFKPVQHFHHMGFPDDILACTKNFERPTPIQSQCWPVLAQGRDVIGIARTGSGKTLGFLMPALVHMAGKKARPKQPMMLVIAPTRELAVQSAVVCDEAGGSCGVTNVQIYGGVPKWPQVNALKAGVHIVVATPGRLKALINEGLCDLSKCQFLVLDEADRMLDQGFEPDIRYIVETMPKKQANGIGRRTLLFSATWPREVEELGAHFTTDAVHIQIGKRGEELTANSDVTQIVEVIEDKDKDRRVVQLMKDYHNGTNRILVFVLYKKDVARVQRLLTGRGYKAVGLSSDKSQNERSAGLAGFKDGSIPVLVATDVAGRGLDIPDVEYVINYSFPLTIEDYVHRIGRTGRGGRKGTAHTFFAKFDKNLSGSLCNVLKKAGANVPEDLMAFGTFVKKKKHSMYGDFAGRESDIPMPKRKKVVF